MIDSISAFFWSQKIEETHGISYKEISSVIIDIISFGRTICVFVGSKGGNYFKFPNSVKIYLEFIRFQGNELISQVTLGSIPDFQPYFMHISAHGCSFTPTL